VSVTPAEPRREWFEVRPERLEWELAQFAERGLPATIARKHDGAMVIATELLYKGEPVPLNVAFPFDYPEVEPTVFGPPGLLPRHQHRHGGNFCLLERPAADWWPTMSAAQLVDEDLRWLFEDTAAGPETVSLGEADMPEPLSEHIHADPRRVALVPDPLWQLELPVAEGELITHDASHGAGQFISEAAGIGSCEPQLLELFGKPDGDRHAGRWVAVSEGAIPTYPTHRELLDAAVTASPRVLSKLKGRLRSERGRQTADGWIGVTFIEEGPRRRQWRRGWVLLEVRVDSNGAHVLRALRAQALTAKERGRRVPELEGLAEASVLVVGAGSVGAPVVFELVKAGVGRTVVVDHDRYDVNNAVRHVLETQWAGVLKAVGVAIEAEFLNPFVSIDSETFRVGSGPDASELLDRLVADADIVVDATGSHAVARILQGRCRAAGKTLVVVGLTAGSYGGEVAVFRADGPCFWCYALSQADELIPEPVSGPTTTTMPVGCSSPAFSGAGFDATALAALAARAVIGATGKCSYPAPDYDFMVVNFRGDEPVRRGRLPAHPKCPLGH
jgi:molybdopterin/thiamine biosynthesis adenylyltransferase